MDPLAVISVVSTILSVGGVAGTIFYGRKSMRLEQRIRRYDWDDIMLGVQQIGKDAFEGFSPDVILSLSGPGSIVSNLLLVHTRNFLPLYVGISRKRYSPNFKCEPKASQKVETNRWITYVPDDVFSHREHRILVCEDCVVTGETLAKIKNLLIAQGFLEMNIRTAALFVTELAETTKLAPDVYWMTVPDTTFYLPWGRSLGRGY